MGEPQHSDASASTECMDTVASQALGERPAVPALDMDLALRRVQARMLGQSLESPRVGRFELREKLGSGGMGTVWRAHDDQLGRSVGLKFLRSELQGVGAELRLFEEAQSLAKLSHPNVIPVYDVGRHEGRVWIAMEYVPGQSLKEWQREAGASAREVLEAWLAAGRGLAAVHAAGLIHRDVKPANVLIGEDGRVRLIDFGLVRAPDVSATAETSDGRGSQTEGRAVRTATGAFVGTPAYAAPEQHDGREVDARADQYAFAVSLWEGLSGARPTDVPLDGSELASLAEGQHMPRRVRRALSRALARDPNARFHDMQALLDALAPSRSRAWVGVALGLTLVVGAGGGIWASTSMGTPAPALCVNAGRAIDETYGSARRESVLDGLPLAIRAAVAVALDEWREDYIAASHTACAEVHIEQTRSPGSLDRRRACLDSKRGEFEVVLSTLEGAPDRVAELDVWLGGLGDPRSCLGEAGEFVVPSADQSERADKLHRDLFALRVGADPRPLDARRLAADALYKDAQLLGLPQSESFAITVCGELAHLAGDDEAARRWAAAHFDHADRHGDAEARADGWLLLAHVEANLSFDFERATWLISRCAQATRSLGDPPERVGELEVLKARIAFAKGALVEAEVALQAAVDRFTVAGSSALVLRMRALQNLALVVAERGRDEEAEQLLAEARGLRRFVDPDAGGSAGGARSCKSATLEAHTDHESGQATAMDLARLALATCTKERGPQSEAVAEVQTLLAGLALEQGRLDASRTHALEADAIYRAVARPGEPGHVAVLTSLATAEFYAGEFEAAVRLYRRALKLALLNSDIPPVDRAKARANLGESLLAAGDPSAARVMLEQALDTLARELGSDHQDTAIPRKALAAALLEQGDADAAKAEAELAQALLEDSQNSVELADTRWLLARVELARGQRELARAHGEAALGQTLALGPDFGVRAQDIRAWLAEVVATE